MRFFKSLRLDRYTDDELVDELSRRGSIDVSKFLSGIPDQMLKAETKRRRSVGRMAR